MTNSKTLKYAATSSTSFLRPVTLMLAAVVALELCVMAQGHGPLGTVAAADGSTIYPPMLQAASVEVRIVAQADTPAR